ncbi:MAG: molecular chaperone TorD family protein [Nitrospirae bacterium]|nr:molecular chaperone TorD family protein [Nitrospirota bacterium]
MENTKAKNMAETARHRSNVYGLLAMIYREEPTAVLLRGITDKGFLSVLSNLGIKFDKGFFDQPEKKLLEDLSVEFARLFLGPGRHISPHESVHHERADGDWGRLWGRSTVEVKKFVESLGFQYKSDYKGLPDHISVELEFMHELTKNEADALEAEDIESALKCREIEKKFIKEHLLKWIPAFSGKIINEAELSFYREMARLTKSFIEIEKTECLEGLH